MNHSATQIAQDHESQKVMQRQQLNEERRLREQAEDNELYRQNRETLFANEKFVIGILQAVNGGIVVGLISQFQNIEKFLGILTIKVTMSSSVLGLIFAVAAAYLKHEYKKWDLKIPSARDRNEYEERQQATVEYLKQMRFSITLSTIFLCAGLVWFFGSIWNA